MVRFDPFALDPARRALTRDGDPVALSPHLVDILGHLVRHAGQVVTKDALLEAFWPGVHVTENTLARAIADIRKALGDVAATPRYIQTVARRGYRFVAAVHAQGPGAADDPLREFVRGRFALESLDARRLPEAVHAFEQAVTAMPGYAPAHTALASGYLLQYEATRALNVPSREPLRRAIEHARRACELDPTLGEAWATLGFVLAAAGEAEEARAVSRRAAALEPTSWRHHFRLSLASWGEERLRACDRTLSLLPEFAPARFAAAMVFTARQAFVPALAAATAGAQAQSRQLRQESPFPSIGLHWLRGLLLLRERQIGLAIESFAREIDELRDAQIYAGEFRVNAQVAAGFAHLAARDATGAIDAFRVALETLPRNGRALIGLYTALGHTTLRNEAPLLVPQIEQTIAELAGGERLIEAAIIRAAAQASQGWLDAACATLQQLLESAPPGQAGWQIPIEPALASLRAHPQFARITGLLAARAA